jgi:hypothetical protein
MMCASTSRRFWGEAHATSWYGLPIRSAVPSLRRRGPALQVLTDPTTVPAIDLPAPRVRAAVARHDPMGPMGRATGVLPDLTMALVLAPVIEVPIIVRPARRARVALRPTALAITPARRAAMFGEEIVPTRPAAPIEVKNGSSAGSRT